MDTDIQEDSVDRITVLCDHIIDKLDKIEQVEIEFDFSIPFSDREINFEN